MELHASHRIGRLARLVMVAVTWLEGCTPETTRGPREIAAQVVAQRSASRLSNLDLQTSALPDPSVVQVYEIGGQSVWPPQDAEGKPDPPDTDLPGTFPLHPYGAGVVVPIRRYRTLRGPEAMEFARLWRHVEFVDGPGMMCHHPAFGFRCFDESGRVTFETSVCWACGNFFLRRQDGGYHWYGLNSGAPGAQALLAHCRKITSDADSHKPSDVGVPPILTGPVVPYVPDALDRFEDVHGEPTNADLAALHDFSSLQSLAIFSPAITDRGLEVLKTLTGLRSLTLRTAGVTDAGLQSLRSLRDLEELSFVEMPVTDRTLAAVADLTKLRGLYISRDGHDPATSPMRGLTDAGLIHLRRLTELRSLSLSGTGITDAGLAVLAHLTKLNDLHLSGTVITGVGIEHLRGLVELKELTIEHAAVTDDGLAVIARLPALEQLYLEKDDSVTDAGMAQLAHAPKLYRLNLEMDAITDAGLKHLAAAPELGYLHLRGTRITDEAIPILQAMPKLKYVWLGETQMSEAGINRLQKLRPDVIIQK